MFDDPLFLAVCTHGTQCVQLIVRTVLGDKGIDIVSTTVPEALEKEGPGAAKRGVLARDSKGNAYYLEVHRDNSLTGLMRVLELSALVQKEAHCSSVQLIVLCMADPFGQGCSTYTIEEGESRITYVNSSWWKEMGHGNE